MQPQLSNGTESEAYVIKYLNTKGWALDPVTDYHTQAVKDIDATQGARTFSIKTQHTALSTGNIACELKVEDVKEGWVKSWYYRGMADYYILRVGCTIYVFKAGHLKRYVKKWGWSGKRNLKRSTVEGQWARGHRHVNAEVGLIRLQQLLDRIPHHRYQLED